MILTALSISFPAETNQKVIGSCRKIPENG
jgi:hypothetical protein